MLKFGGLGNSRIWWHRLAPLLGGHAFSQALGLITAVFILRILPVDAYALYTVANAVIAVGAILSDLNLSTAFNTLGARASLSSRVDFSSLHAAVVGQRRLLFLTYFIIAPVLIWLSASNHGWSIGKLTLIVAAMSLQVWIQQTINIAVQILNIYHDGKAIGFAMSAIALARVGFVPLIVWLFPTALTAIISNALVLGIGAFWLNRVVRRYLDTGASYTRLHVQSLWQFARPLLPSTIYFAFQGQISIMLLSVFGQTDAVAQIGALGRLSQIIMVFSVVNSFLIQPLVAKATTNEQVFKAIRSISVVFIACASLLALVSVVLPQLFTALLGSTYSTLNGLVFPVILGALLTLGSGLVYTMLLARSFTRFQLFNPIILVTAQIIYIYSQGVDTTEKAVWFGVLSAFATFFVQLTILGFAMLKWTRDSKSSV